MTIWTRQPPRTTRLKQWHLSARGVILAVDFLNGTQRWEDLSGRTGAIASATPNPKDYSSSARFGPLVGAATTQRPAANVAALNAAWAASGEATLLVLGRSTIATGHGSGEYAEFAFYNGGSWEHYPFTDGNIYLGTLSGTRWVSGVSAATAGIFSPHVAIVTHRSGAQAFYTNGVLRASGSVVETPQTTYATLGEHGASYLVVAWNRVLRADEIASLSSNPWQLFAEYDDDVLVGPAAAASATITPSSGSIVVTGSAPIVGRTYSIAPGAGAITLTGLAPTVAKTAHQVVTPAAGAVTLAGSAPSVARTEHQVRTPAAGDVVLAGAAPTLAVTAHQTVTPSAGSLVLTGAAPSVAATAHQAITPASASLLIAGAAPTVAVSGTAVITPAAGAVLLTGAVPVLAQTAHQTVRPAAGSVVVTGSAPTVARTAHQSITPTAGDVQITGAAPALSSGIVIRPASGVLTLAGAAPTVARTEHQTATPGAADVHLAGYAPVLTIGGSFLMRPAAAAIVITGAAPTVTRTGGLSAAPEGRVIASTAVGRQIASATNPRRIH